jgi:CRISPR-associated protein Cas1
MDLIVEGQGIFVGKHQGRLRVTKDGKTLQEMPVIHLKHVMLIGKGIAISSDVIECCASEGIPIHFLDALGHADASLYSAGLIGTVMTRRAQLGAYTNDRGARLIRTFVTGKIFNQAHLLRYMAHYRQTTDPEIYHHLQQSATEIDEYRDQVNAMPPGDIETMREPLLLVEAHAAQRYWQAIGTVIPETLGWTGRITRGAIDPFNSALNYGYGILYTQIERALVLAGLDPYGGFLHADRPNKPSLVLDLIEEFRQIVVDRTVVGLVNRRVEIKQDEQHLLDDTTRHMLASKILERCESAELYEKKRQPLRCIIQSQARHLATYMRGEREDYLPFAITL